MIASTSDFPVRRQSIWLTVLLWIVTVGAYGPYWFFNRRSGFHSLSSEQRLPEVALILVLIAAIVSAVLTVVSFFPSDPSWIEPTFEFRLPRLIFPTGMDDGPRVPGRDESRAGRLHPIQDLVQLLASATHTQHHTPTLHARFVGSLRVGLDESGIQGTHSDATPSRSWHSDQTTRSSNCTDRPVAKKPSPEPR